MGVRLIRLGWLLWFGIGALLVVDPCWVVVMGFGALLVVDPCWVVVNCITTTGEPGICMYMEAEIGERERLKKACDFEKSSKS